MDWRLCVAVLRRGKLSRQPRKLPRQGVRRKKPVLEGPSGGHYLVGSEGSESKVRMMAVFPAVSVATASLAVAAAAAAHVS